MEANRIPLVAACAFFAAGAGAGMFFGSATPLLFPTGSIRSKNNDEVVRASTRNISFANHKEKERDAVVAVSSASAASSAAGMAGLVPHIGWASSKSPGCVLQALVSKPFSLTWHGTGEFWLAAYGSDDYVTVRY